mgnify:CR=1 FL=1|jgi:GNAT superfamily N-acetyltransferase
MEIRRAVPADLDPVTELVREFYAIDRHEFDAARVRRALGPLLADDTHGQVWVLCGDGRIDGYGVLTWGYSIESGGRDVLLDELYVRQRGDGLGTRFLTTMLDAAAAAGASRVFLETEAHNERVRAFYARLGFRTEDSAWMSREL